MDFATYQRRSRETARYPDAGANPIYPTLGLCGESGEVGTRSKRCCATKQGTSMHTPWRA